MILLAAAIVTMLATKTFSADINSLQKQAEAGDAEAQSELGMIYAKGQGVTQDFSEAAKWIRKAAEQGVAQAQYNLGGMYSSGQGVVQDYVEAVRWYGKAAEQGIAQARHELGVMFDKGLGATLSTPSKDMSVVTDEDKGKTDTNNISKTKEGK